MIQPCLYNRKEYKVVVLSGQPFLVSTFSWSENKRCANGINKAFVPREDKSELLKFCTEQVKLFKQNCPSAITDGLVRVDFARTICCQRIRKLRGMLFRNSASRN